VELVTKIGSAFLKNYDVEVAVQKSAADVLAAEAVEARRRESERNQRISTYLSECLYPINCDISFLQPEHFDETDLRLALSWLEADDQVFLYGAYDRAGIPGLLLEADNSRRLKQELSRVLTARIAENVASVWLQHNGYSTEDVSVQQLEYADAEARLPGRDAAWHTFDIRAFRQQSETTSRSAMSTHHDSQSVAQIDVKCARRVLGSSSVYTREYVKTFKLFAGDEVLIVGVQAPYLWPNKILPEVDTSEPLKTRFVVRGWTGVRRLRELAQFFGNVETVRLEQSSKGDPTRRLAPWLYEAPARLYGPEKALEMIGDAHDRKSDFPSASGLTNLQACVLSKISRVTLVENTEKSLAGWQDEFFSVVREAVNQLGQTLPVLYLSILRHFVIMVKRGAAGLSSPEYSPALYRELLWVHSSEQERREFVRSQGAKPGDDPKFEHFPFGVWDPHLVVSALISALDILWSFARAEIVKFNEFSMSGRGILRAREAPMVPWKTVLSYCGNPQKVDRPCCHFPLLIGSHEHCAHGFLICTEENCGYCCSACHQSRKSEGPGSALLEDVD